MHDQCIYCESTSNVYNSRCEECAVAEFDNENAHGRSPWSESDTEGMVRVIAASRYSRTYNKVGA